MIEEILPSWVAAVETFGDDPADWLWPAEADLVARAVESRVREFTSGRMCARRALALLGIKSGPILSGAQREALWPGTVIGSITHCKGKRLRKLQVEGMRLQVQAELRDAGFDSQAMNALAGIHPLRKIAEAVLDGLGGLTIGRLGAAARIGFDHLVEFLRNIFENCFPSRVALTPLSEDPDVAAAITKGVAEAAAKIKARH